MKPQCETADVVPQQPTSANDLRQPQSIDERSKAEEATVDQAPRPGPREAMPRPLELPSFDPGTIFVDFFAYLQDAAERSVLFWDTLRRRAENMVAHERAGKPPLLDFDYEVLLDARRFEHQANYALLRVTGVGDACIEDCLEETKPPVIVIDPRAGHGPGIGGFKQDSEVGIALREGYPVYFVMFYPEPVAGQTLADVLLTLRRFLENVARRHPGKAPVLYGNCQAGWAAALLAADCEGLSGPTVLNGSPLSYWAGVPGMNPMRIAGGLVGGAWLTHFLADLGNGRFDGAWLVQNFEGLKPETVWEKYAHLFAEVDTERDRFLEFERWWSGFYFLSREEILAIVENLFIGNRLEEGRVRICEGCEADLRRIRNPLIIFASYGDNITPPHQALGWVPAVYKDTADLKRAGQRIVYLTNPHVGHLGIFVSAKVARREHRAILQSLGRIQALPPGLYEMKITDPVGDPDCHDDAYAVRFEERDVADIQFPTQSAAFERVRELSERNEALYTTFVSPWVQAFATPWSAAVFEQLHPLRASHYLLSGAFMPWMRGMAGLATFVNEDRHSIRSDNPFKALETEILSQVGDAVEVGRKLRDAVYERNFDQAYGAMPMTRRLDEPPQGNSPGPSVAPAQHNRYRAGARRTQQNQRVEGDT